MGKSYQRKINPLVNTAQAHKPDGTANDNDRVEIGPTQLAFDEWHQAGLGIPNLKLMRQQRFDRLLSAIQARDLAGVLLFDPMNIRFATDSTNMQLWNAHNMFRACLLLADGHMVMWDYKGEILNQFNPLVKEVRASASFFYFINGDKADEDARLFAAEVDDLLRTRTGANRRLAVDKIMPNGYRELISLGVDVRDGEEVLEKARAIKQSEEIKALRCAAYACERAINKMREQMQPGISENELWSVLHAENIKRGGEWIETRLMASGPRTNPWFQECGPRVMQNGDLLAFDTDMVGCYGMCTDISRTWLVGDKQPTQAQKKIYTEAYLQIIENMALLKPGVSFKALSFGGRQLPECYVKNRYGVKMHGVGLCDEWPSILYPQDYRENQFDYVLEEGMVLSVETYIGAEGGREGVKLEEQIVITETGFENISHYPYEESLINR